MFLHDKDVILAIDDDPGTVNSVMSVLKQEYIVKPFTAGAQALRYLEQHTADLILMDYYMPHMTGAELLEILQQDPATSKIPVIFLTGSGSDDTEVSVLGRGAKDYIQKPVKAPTLLARVKLQLELRNYQQRLEELVEEKTKDLVFAYTKLKLREQITLGLLARVTDMRDHDTGDHILRTTKFTQLLTHALLKKPGTYFLDEKMAEDITMSVKLHDIGKIAIPDHILQKKGPLTKEEFEIVKLHPMRGATLLDEFIIQLGHDSFLNTARDIVLRHHERWDGTGYPGGLRGGEIPLSARITALADVYDALTSSRPYKEPFSHEKAVHIIKENNGSHFDPYLVELFLAMEQDFENIILTP